MHLTINIPLRAKTFQDKKIVFTGKFPRLIKSKQTKFFTEQVHSILINEKENLENFAALFDKKKHALEAHYVFTYPDLYTKEGWISSKIPDIGNDFKAIQDIIFGFLNLDDKFITRLTCEKKAGNENIYLFLKIIEK